MLDLSEPYKTLTNKNNGLSAAQEVLYAKDFKDANKTTQQDNNKTTQQDKNKKSDK